MDTRSVVTTRGHSIFEGQTGFFFPPRSSESWAIFLSTRFGPLQATIPESTKRFSVVVTDCRCHPGYVSEFRLREPRSDECSAAFFETIKIGQMRHRAVCGGGGGPPPEDRCPASTARPVSRVACRGLPHPALLLAFHSSDAFLAAHPDVNRNVSLEQAVEHHPIASIDAINPTFRHKPADALVDAATTSRSAIERRGPMDVTLKA